MKYTIEQLATLIGARRSGNVRSEISFLLTDSRSLSFPEETLFFSLRTSRNDGQKYIPELYQRGVRNFVIQDSAFDTADYPKANFLVVPDTLRALQRLAERHREEFDIPIVGITGSNGKTMVKEWLYQILRSQGVKESGSQGVRKQGSQVGITRSPRNYNSQIGVPLSVWLLDEQTRIGIFEAGISMPGEMEALHDIIQPTIGIFTSLGEAHQENFRSLEEKCMEKLQLFHDAKVIIYPSDDDIISRCIRRSGFKGERIGWSRKNSTAPIYVEVSPLPASPKGADWE